MKDLAPCTEYSTQYVSNIFPRISNPMRICPVMILDKLKAPLPSAGCIKSTAWITRGYCSKRRTLFLDHYGTWMPRNVFASG